MRRRLVLVVDCARGGRRRRGRRFAAQGGQDPGVPDRVLQGEAGHPGPFVPGRLPRRLAIDPGDPPPVRPGEVGGVGELVRCRGPAAGHGDGELTGVAGQGRIRDVVVQAPREAAAAQRLQEVPACFGQDVAAGEGAAHREDDGRDVDGGERGVDHLTRARITAPAARHLSSSPLTTSWPKRRIADARHHARSCPSGLGVFFARRVSCAAHQPSPCRACSPGSRPCSCAYL